MFKLFKKKSRIEKLYEQYDRLQKEAYNLSTTSRVQSDLKMAEAQQVLTEIEALEKSGSQ